MRGGQAKIILQSGFCPGREEPCEDNCPIQEVSEEQDSTEQSGWVPTAKLG